MSPPSRSRAAWCALTSLLLAACGSTAGSAQDRGAAAQSGGLDAGSGTPDAAVTDVRDAGRAACPTALPTDGAPCTAFIECEYGGDALGRGRTVATCSADVSGSTRWQRFDESQTPNDAACPARFDAIASGGACPVNRAIACDWDEGRCACECVADGAPKWICRARADVPVDVHVVPAPSPLPVCSPVPPFLGSPCDFAPDVDCVYGAFCVNAPLSFGIDRRCIDGVWRGVANGGGACALPHTCF